MIDRSPIAAMLPPAPTPEPRQRAWFNGAPADAFIVKLWRYASEAGADVERFLKLLLLLGKRRGAILHMKWSDINEDWYWTPPKGSKNKRTNAVPLPRLARRIMGTRQESYVLLRRFGEGDMVRLAERVSKAVEPNFFIHGIRHVVATKLAELKTPPHIARLLLDHAGPGDAHSGYEHVDWTDEMLAALELWAGHIERLVAPAEGVTVLR